MRLMEKCVWFLAASALVWGQGPLPAQGQGPAPQQRQGPAPQQRQGPGGRMGPMPGGPRQGLGGKWWDNPEMVKRLEITADQQKKMDDVWQQSRLKLIDLSATLEKEEVMMGGLMKGPQLDDAKILPAVDRIAQARAELEKANARLMLGIRHLLTAEQWEKMENEGPRGRREGPMNGGPGQGPSNGPGGGGPGGGGPGGGGPGRPPQEE